MAPERQSKQGLVQGERVDEAEKVTCKGIAAIEDVLHRMLHVGHVLRLHRRSLRRPHHLRKHTGTPDSDDCTLTVQGPLH